MSDREQRTRATTEQTMGDSAGPAPESDAAAGQLEPAEPAGGEAVVSEELTQALQALEQMHAQAAENLEYAQRAQAELRNFRRRTEQEMEQIRRGAAERLIARLLPVIDDFNRAVDAVPAEERDKPWTQGILLIRRKLWSILEQEGVRPIDAVGQQFDPAVHEAVTVEPEAGDAATMVVEEFQRGYRLHDRVLRPAMVKVGAARDGQSGEPPANGATEARTPGST